MRHPINATSGQSVGDGSCDSDRHGSASIEQTDAGQPHRSGMVGLLFSAFVIVLVWCVVLPRVAAVPQVRDYTDWLDDRGIDPSATYYTELEAMKPILHRLERPKLAGR